MAPQEPAPNYLEQMTTLFSAVASYMRIPVLVSSVHLPSYSVLDLDS
jgi:hypothetical protein